MRTELHDAAAKGDVERIKELVELGFSVHEETNTGDTALHCAVWEGKVDVIPYLISHGANVNHVNHDSRTPLYLAALRGNVSAIQCLVRCNSNVNYRRKDGYFSKNGDTALHAAAISGSVDAIQYLINKCGADRNLLDYTGQSALHYAVHMGHVNVSQCLVNEFNFNVNLADKYNKVPLHTAAYMGCFNLVQCLVNELQAKVNITDSSGNTPLHYAAENKDIDTDTIRCLIKHDALVDMANLDGETPLHRAAWGGAVNAIRHFVSKVNVNIANEKNGNTPLHRAALSWHNNFNTLECLVKELNADLYAKNKEGKTPFDVATEKNKKLLRKLMDEQDAKKKQQKQSSRTKTETNNFSYTKPLPTPPKRTSKPSNTKTTAEIQTELKKELAITPQQSLEKALLIAPKELVEDASAKLKEKEEQLAQVLAEKRALEKQIEVLKQDQQSNASEIKRLENKIVTIEETLTLLEPLTSLQRAKNDSIALFAQNPNALEFYNTTHTFLKAFFDGICGAYNPVVSKKANGSLNAIAGVIEKISGWVSFLPFGNMVCNFLSGQLNDQSLKIIKNRITWLTYLSKQPELPLILEKIARELTIRHEDDITKIDNTQNIPSKLKQIKDEFYKEGEFSSVQNLAEYAVSMMIGDMLEGKNVSTANLQDRCLAAVLKVSSGLGFLTKKIDAFFSKSVVRMTVNNQSNTTTENCHYGDFFSRSINQNNNVTLTTPTPSNKTKVTPQVTAFTPAVPKSDETIKKVDHLEKAVSTLQQQHEELSRSHSHITYQLKKTTASISQLEKGKSKINAIEIDCGEQMQMQEIPLVNPAEIGQGLFSNSSKTVELEERNQELEKNVTGLKEEQKILQDKISLLEEKVKETNRCVPRGCLII